MVERQHTELIAKLTSATGITALEAATLVEVLGTNWSSLVREARIIRRSASTPRPPATLLP
jgi:hypothetical protein